LKNEARGLILQAFRMARDSGKADWRRMAVAVLKNRLLQLTRGAFSETAFGAQTFPEFVLRDAEITRLDKSTWPPIVELTVDLPQRAEDVAPPVAGQGRVRSDRPKRGRLSARY
jgi:hypothetical protein